MRTEILLAIVIIPIIISIILISSYISPPTKPMPSGEGKVIEIISPPYEPAFSSENMEISEFDFPSPNNPQLVVNINMPATIASIKCYVLIDLEAITPTIYTYPSKEQVSAITQSGKYLFSHTKSVDRTKDHAIGVCCEEICVTKTVEKL